MENGDMDSFIHTCVLSTSHARLLLGAGDLAVKKLGKVLLLVGLLMAWESQTAKHQTNV